MAEFELIERIRRRAAARDDVILGIGDDAALLQPPAGKQLAVAMDTLNAGVHFPRDTAPADIGWKSLAVNLSDLAAMGAEPAWCTLSLSLPESDEGWIDSFLDGFLDLASQHRVALVGGDTTCGPLSVSVTVHGFVEPGRALRRDAARVGDTVWISGTLGAAAAALALISPSPAGAVRRACEPLARAPRSTRALRARAGAGVRVRDAAILASLRQRLDRPIPRVTLGRALPIIVHAGIDISDGLLADLDHVCEASGVGMRIALDRLPASEELRSVFDAEARTAFQCSGGDDYELAFTVPADADDAVLAAAVEVGVPVTRIGEVVVGERVRAFDADGAEWLPPARGYAHFDGRG